MTSPVNLETSRGVDGAEISLSFSCHLGVLFGGEINFPRHNCIQGNVTQFHTDLRA